MGRGTDASMPLPRSFTGSGEAALAAFGEFDRWSCALWAFTGEALRGEAALAAFGEFDRWSCALWTCAVAGNVGLFIFRDVALAGLAGL